MSLAKRTGSNLTWVLLSDILAKAGLVFATIYLARTLGVLQFGVFSLGVAIANSLWPLVDMGTTGYGIREVAREHGMRATHLANLTSIRVACALVVALATAIVVVLLYGTTPKGLALLCGVLYLVFYSALPDWFLRGSEYMKGLFLVNAAATAFFLIGILVVVDKPDDVVDASLLRSLSFGVGAVIAYAVIFSKFRIGFRLSCHFGRWLMIANQTRSFLLNRIAANLIQYVPFFAVSVFLGDKDAGLFAAPHRLFVVCLAVIAAFGSAIYPILSDVHRKHPDQFPVYQRQVLQMVLIMFIPLASLGFLLSEPVTALIFGEAYQGSHIALRVLLFVVPVSALRTIYMYTLYATDNEHSTYPVTMLALMMQGGLAVFAVPAYGVNGAAMVVLFSEVIIFLLMFYLSITRAGVKSFLDRDSVAVTVVTLLVTLACMLSVTGIIEVLSLGGLLYLSGLFVCGQLKINDIRSMLSRS
ncbi:MAG: oligosaccharide flippase family protein [Gammaproteobacteria bacterium]|nr:oligosaccharide flippase family protein [Gammaproteobacteria bacterium]